MSIDLKMMDHNDKIKHMILTYNISPCTNKCRHCWAIGDEKRNFMNMDDIDFLIDETLTVGDLVRSFYPYFFYEPSIHPQFFTILDKFYKIGIIPADHWYMPTNGAGFSKFTDLEWEQFKSFHNLSIGLTFHGLKEYHDSFVKSEGAFDKIITTLVRAREFGIKHHAQYTFNKNNIKYYYDLKKYIFDLFPDISFGSFLMTPSFDTDDFGLITDNELRQLSEEDFAKKKKLWTTEKENVDTILNNEGYRDLSARDRCGGSNIFQIYDNLDVYFGSACDSGGVISNVRPEYKKHFFLGNLKNKSLMNILEDFTYNSPEVVKMLENVSYYDLAKKYGNKTENLFAQRILIEDRYAAQFLMDNLKI
ncbi:MAG: hypothetical protein JXR48_19060 [Candidatus Delongbacteria bacterium]|nr:hypothetical protein [Candidatus Delongbacteria bacterium]MBN2837061.1 hypothetical protein [Candidatus Delongbacteria bacterium]